MSPAPTNDQKLQALYAHGRRQAEEINSLKKSLEEITALVRSAADAPKWIEEIPGRRVPYIAVIELLIPAQSTARVEGTYTVSTDGPFAVTGVAMFWQRLEEPYDGIWGPATTFDNRIAQASQGQGFDFLLDQPHTGSFDVEIADRGSDRNWQNFPFASALFAPQSAGTYVLPVANLFGKNSVASVNVTPTKAQLVAGKIGVYLLGYKIVQGDTYQP